MARILSMFDLGHLVQQCCPIGDQVNYIQTTTVPGDQSSTTSIISQHTTAVSVHTLVHS